MHKELRRLLTVDHEITRLVFGAMMPGLRRDEIKALKRREREARQEKRQLCNFIRAAIRSRIPG